ncbi:tripartite motif-containing protein 2-like [Anneissia japonica]|uniref:tripartite motif-containing protein 2-like n=1 Tax=Anneissia japonica TaxID=1529436 RepID=UPI0014258282|nr:tripartite motif-containing protein 2-like [Anneissia japonica]
MVDVKYCTHNINWLKIRGLFKMATSQLNQFWENVDEKVLECTICLKRLQNPKSLNCLHTFCLACLEDWVRKEKGKLTCPTCSKSYPIPEGGLQKLPPNTFIINLLETIEQFSEKDQMKCVCGKGQAKYYCQECRQYLCSACSDHHKILPVLANHKLHSVEDVQSMTPLEIASLHPQTCSLHNEPSILFCYICNVPICMHCTITDHKVWEGEHKPISISEEFQKLKETSATLEKSANDCKTKLQNGLKDVIQTVTELEKSKCKSLSDIDNHVHEMVKIVQENGDKMKNEVETNYQKKKKVLDIQIDELKSTIFGIDTKLSFLNQLLKSDDATAMQSSETLNSALKERINELPKTEPDDNGKIYFFVNKQQMASLQQCDIGTVTQFAVDCLTLKGEESVTQGQTFVAKVAKTGESEIPANQLKAKCTQLIEKTSIMQVQEDDNGDYSVTGKCTSPGVCKLYVSADGIPIKQSPMMIKVEKEGLVNIIKIKKEDAVNVNRFQYSGAVNKNVDVVKCEDDCLLVSCGTNEMLKYKQSGEYIGKVTLPQGVKVDRMYKMKNGNIAFRDTGTFNHDIKVCNMYGQVIKSIGQVIQTLIGRGWTQSIAHAQRMSMDNGGIHVDEASNVMYVADCENGCVVMFGIDSGKMMKTIGCQGQLNRATDVTLTNQGNLLVLDMGYGLQLFDNEGRFLKVLVNVIAGNGRYPLAVVVDEDDNIIISSNHKLELFSSDGNFIKRINKPEDKIHHPLGLSIISYYPRRLAVADNGDNTVKIFNY